MLKDFFNFKQKSLFPIHDPAGVKLLSRLQLKFSHLNEHKFRHNFKDAPNPMVTVAPKLKQQTTLSFVARFLQEIDKNSLIACLI